MNITVTFTDTGDAGMPDGSTLVFEDVDGYEVSTPAGIEEIDCAAACCDGCNALHRRLTGTARLVLEASGRRQALLWKIPDPIVHACPFDGEQDTPCCHRTPFDLPRDEKITTDHRAVTCRGGGM